MSHAATLAADARTNDPLRRALQQFPDYAQAIDLRAAIIQAQKELRGVRPVPSPAGADRLTEFLEAVSQRAIDTAVFEAQRGALMSLRGEVDQRLTGTITAHATEILRSLGDELAELMAEVGDVARALDGASTAAEAIARGTEDAWRRLPHLRDRYDEIRSAQRSVVLTAFDPHLMRASTSQHLEDDMASDLILANLDEILPSWRRADDRYTLAPSNLADRRPWPLDDQLGQLVWLAGSTANPWIPSEPQVRRLHAQRHARIAKANMAANAEKPEPATAATSSGGNKFDRVISGWRAIEPPVDLDD